MAKTHITKRFDFDVICGGVLYAIHRPLNFAKIHKFLHQEMFFENVADDKVVALRELVSVAKAVFLNKDNTFEFTIRGIRNQILLRNIDGEKGVRYANHLDVWLSDHNINAIASDPVSFDILVTYLQMIDFAKKSKELSVSYQTGKVDEVEDQLRKMISGITQIRDAVSENSETLTKQSALAFLQKNYESATSKMINNEKLYMGQNTWVDQKINGFEKKTLNLIIGATGGGKSVWAHHILRRCITQKIHAHIFCVEDREESFLYKFIACQTGIPMRDLKMKYGVLSDEQKSSIRRSLDDFEKYITVDFFYGRGVDEIHQKSLERDTEKRVKGIQVPIVHIVDYTGHISSFSSGDKKFEQMRNAYGARKDFALKHDKICFDFAQINREGGKKMAEDIITHNDLAGAFDIAQVCDNIISVNRGKQDIEEKNAVLMICKARDGESGVRQKIKTMFECNRYDMEIPEPIPDHNPPTQYHGV
jgi:DnaB-like helicase C terminal domain